MRRILSCAVVAVALWAAACARARPPGARGEPINVAAAADLGVAFKDVGEAFEKTTGHRVVLAFGATGTLAAQIANGAPYNVFAAANAISADELVRRGICFEDSKTPYAIGRIAVWGKKGSSVPRDIRDLVQPRFARIAIADVQQAPYGAAAKQALLTAGIWNDISARVVYAGNVQEALAAAQSGKAEVAIVALSLAVVSEGEYALIDASLHAPLEQVLVVCRGNPATDASVRAAARAFATFVASDSGRAIMRRHGFFLPDEPVGEGGR
jgi:molybdate transport system substrate-binding protein